MLLEQYYGSQTGWLDWNHIFTYSLGEYTWNGIRPSGEQPTAFQLDNSLMGTYSIDIEITNNDTIDTLEGIPNLVILINNQNVSLSQICPDAWDYYAIDPEDSVTLTATLDAMNYGGHIDIFGVDTYALNGTSDCSVRVISSDIFTGWMTRNDYADVKVYDNGSWTS